MVRPVLLGVVVFLLLEVGSGDAHIGSRIYPIWEIPEVELSTIDLRDGSVAEWKAILGPPTLQATDFSNSPTIPWDGSYDAADLTWSMWVGWSSSTGRLYVAIERADNEYLSEYALGSPFQFPGNDLIELMIDGDHSGGEYGFAPDCCGTQEAWRRVHDSQAQHLVIAGAPDQQHLGYVGYGGASFAPSPATSWPYADAGGISLGSGIAASVYAQTPQFEANGSCGGTGGEIQVYDSHGFSYHPIIPTDHDSISLAIFGNFPSSGYAVAQSLIALSNDTVFVDARMSFAGGLQLTEMVPWAVHACLPPRSEGVFIVSITIEQEGPRGSQIRRLAYPIPVISIPNTTPLGVAWVVNSDLSEVLSLAQVGASYTVGVVPTAEWSGEPTRMWFSIPSAVMSVKEGSVFQSAGCQSQFRTAEANSAELDIQCVAWEANSPIFSFEVTVSDQFSGWADIRMDSLEGHGERMLVGDTARLLAIGVGTSLVMDFDGDQLVDFDDFFTFADAFGSSNSFFDFNSSGRVDFDDFFIFADSFGKSRQP